MVYFFSIIFLLLLVEPKPLEKALDFMNGEFKVLVICNLWIYDISPLPSLLIRLLFFK